MDRSWTSTTLSATRRRRSPSTSICTIPDTWSQPRCRVSPSWRRVRTSYSLPRDGLSLCVTASIHHLDKVKVRHEIPAPHCSRSAVQLRRVWRSEASTAAVGGYPVREVRARERTHTHRARGSQGTYRRGERL